MYKNCEQIMWNMNYFNNKTSIYEKNVIQCKDELKFNVGLRCARFSVLILTLLFVALNVCFAFGSNNKDNDDDFSHIKQFKSDEINALFNSAVAPVLMRDIKNAKERIVVCMYDLQLYDSKNDARSVMDELRNAQKRGVKVYILLNVEAGSEKGYDGHSSLSSRVKTLESYGFIVDTDNADRRMHAKIIMIDDHIVYTGSHNFTSSALSGRNFEFTLRVVSDELAQFVSKKVFGYFKSN